MKNNIYFLLAILFLFSSCQTKFDNPLAEVDKALAQPHLAHTGYSNIQLFTIGKALSSSPTKQLMKTSIDYNTQFDQMGIFLFIDDQIKKQKTFTELTSIDLSDNKDADSKYVGRKTFSLTEKKYSQNVDSLLFKLVLHEKGTQRTITNFRLRKTNTSPYGIQHYEKYDIREAEMIRLYSFDLRRGTSFEQMGYHAKLVLAYYDSSKKEELVEMLDWNIYDVLRNHSDKLVLPNQLIGLGDYNGQDSDFQGFAFDEDGE